MSEEKTVGRPPYEPSEKDRHQVEAWAAVGTPQEDIAKLLDIDPKTLRKHYRRELDTGSIRANAIIGGKLFNKAKAGDNACMIFWMKSRAGWSEKVQFDATVGVYNVIPPPKPGEIPEDDASEES